MATFIGQPFKFQHVPPEDVFPLTGFWSALLRFENFLQVFVENQTSNQRLPRKLVADRVISNNTINDWVACSAPPLLMALVCVSQPPGSSSTSHRYREMLEACIEAATTEVQQRAVGEIVKYVKKAGEVIHQAVKDKAVRFPFFGQYFIEGEVVKGGVTAALAYVDEDKQGIRFNLLKSALSTVNDSQFFNEAYVANNREALFERAYYVRANDWFVFFQEYYGSIPGAMNVQVKIWMKRPW